MDRRTMKKYINHWALFKLDQFDSQYSVYVTVAQMLDIERTDVTEAQAKRFVKLLSEMVEKAESKLPD
jgi:hypothetical protein